MNLIYGEGLKPYSYQPARFTWKMRACVRCLGLAIAVSPLTSTRFVTGLGAVTPDTATNRSGAGGQSVIAPMIVGVNDGGVRLVSSEYAVGMIGVYIISFEVPADTATGTFRSLAIAADPGTGNLNYGQGSSIAAIQ